MAEKDTTEDYDMQKEEGSWQATRDLGQLARCSGLCVAKQYRGRDCLHAPSAYVGQVVRQMHHVKFEWHMWVLRRSVLRVV